MPRTKNTPSQAQANIAKLRAAGLSYSHAGRAGLVIVRHRGLTVEVWTGSGRWRPRTMGGAIPAIRTDGVDALVAVLTAEELPEWMVRRAG